MLRDDVLIVGAGPAGAVAAAQLARAGARVRLVDRASFPRPKLCGDTINPGTVAMLRRGGALWADSIGEPVEGMVITGTGGVRVEGRYPHGVVGRAVERSELDWRLLQEAAAAGAIIDLGINVRAPLVETARSGPRVTGVKAITSGGAHTSVPARITIAADGRRSTLAFGLGLAKHPRRPRRWAAGGYFEGVEGVGRLGEMHVRAGRYIGVARTPSGAVNVCVVTEDRAGFDDPSTLLRDAVDRDPILAGRFASARLIVAPTVLGPLAVDARAAGTAGLLLAGDAAGFIDPMTGDGLCFAVRSAHLAAQAAIEALNGRPDPHRRLARRYRRMFWVKRRFNRALRALTGSPAAIGVAARTALVAPQLIRALVAAAGDVSLARPVAERGAGA